MLWVMRCLALLHFAWGFLLVLVACYLGMAMLGILPHMSSGALWTNLPGALLLASIYSVPPGALGGWMIVLGRWAWTMNTRLRSALLVTHGVLMVLGTLAVVTGVHAMRAAERSTASGGGIMSPLAMLPLVFGIPVLVLALCSIATALTMTSSTRGVKTGP